MRRFSVLIVLACLLLLFGCKTQAETQKSDAKPALQGESSAPDGELAQPNPAVEEPKAEGREPIPEQLYPAMDEQNEAEYAQEEAALQKTLLGTVAQKPWSKSTESWDAGGSEYYVLKVDGGDESHILRFSDAVPFEAFAGYDGKHVEVVGVFVEAKPYVPQQPTEQYPMGFDGKPVPRGSGFQVTAISEK